MCGTASNNKTKKAVEERFKAQFAVNVKWEPILLARAFAADALPVITAQQPNDIQMMRWGLIPSFVQTDEQAQSLRVQTINCRTETIFEKASFKDAILKQRCLVLVNGFVEYKHIGKQKQPYYIYTKNQQLFAMAGIYNAWRSPLTGNVQHTFSIATVPAHAMMAEIHNSKLRMPLMLHVQQEQAWLSAKNQEDISKCFTQYAEEDMAAHPISPEIGKRDFTPHEGMYEPISFLQQGSLF